MFERLISSFLTRFLREYVDDSTFTRETVKLGIWTGYLVLEDMHIKKSLLDMLELPLALAHGVIGRLEIRIPWTNLGRDPVVIVIDQVFLVVEPKFEWDADAVKRREETVKSARIATAELFRNSPLDDVTAASAEVPNKAWWGSGLQKWVTDRVITRIVDSLQIHVREVHVRYEDHLSQPGSPFYVGAMIESLDAVSTSGSWKRQAGTPKGLRARSSSFWNSAVTRKRNGAKTGGRVSRGTTAPEAEGVVAGTGGRDKLVKKELSLNQLALYWNPAEDGNPCSMYLSDIPVEQAEVVMSRLTAKKGEVYTSEEEGEPAAAEEPAAARGEELRHRYILKPVDAKARLTLSVDPMDRSQPKWQAQVEVGAMSSRVEDFQLQGGMCLGAALARYEEVGKYSKYRPDVPVRVDPLAWWRFAFRVVVERLRAERGWRQAFPDIARRRRMRLEYMPLWQKSRGWAAAHGEETTSDYPYDDGAGIEPRLLASPTASSAEDASTNREYSPGSTGSSSEPYSAPAHSGLDSSGEDDVDVEAPVWPAGLSGQRAAARRRSRRRSRRAAAHEEVVSARARLEELENELSVEDIMFFRAMAEREESQNSGRGRRKSGGGNRWGIGGWVSWAMGPADGDGRSLPGEEDEKQPESAEENFRRLFAAIDLDPSRSSSARPPSVRVKTTAAEGGKTVTSDPEGWLAVSLTLHADEGDMVLVNSSTSAAARHAPELMSSSSGATPFAGVRFHGFHLCLELHGDDMDGVLASVTLDDLSVHQIEGSSAHHRNARLTSVNRSRARVDDQAAVEFVGTPIVARRAQLKGLPSSSTSSWPSPSPSPSSSSPLLRSPPLFDMHVEVNPRDPEYGARVYLDIDQVEAVISPTADWLKEAIMFARAPAELENRPTLKLAASNQLRNLQAQLEFKLEMAMAQRLRTYLDLNVKAPIVAVSVDLSPTASVDLQSSSVVVDPIRVVPTARGDDGAENKEDQGTPPIPGVQRRGRASMYVAPVLAPAVEHLVVDLGDISLSTARLAHLVTKDTGVGHSTGATLAAASAASVNDDVESSKASPSVIRRSHNESELGGLGWTVGSTPRRRRRARSASDVGSPAGGAEGWHANFYDVYNIGIGRVGVLLARSSLDAGGGDDGVDGLVRRAARSIDASTLADGGSGGGSVIGGDGAGQNWLVQPFDVKLETHLSVIPSDPNISQLKVYADLPGLRVRLSQNKLRRLAEMSAAITAQSAALEAKRLVKGQPSDAQRRPDERGGDELSGSGLSPLMSFLDFQRALSNRFDYLHQAASAGPSPTVMTTHSFNSLGSRSRVSEQSLDWESNGDAKDSEASLASAWGGSSSGVGGGRGNGYDSDRGSAGLATRLLSSSSAESEFYDAIDGESGADDSDPPLLPALAAEAEVGIPPRQVLGGGAGVSEVKEGDLSGGADGGGQSDDDSLEFEDARDPIAEMDEALMAKEAEKAELMKRRHKLGEELARSDLADSELQSVRAASEEVSKSLEMCEDELKDLEIALEEMTEVFENVGRQAGESAGPDELGSLSRPTLPSLPKMVSSDEPSQGQESVAGQQQGANAHVSLPEGTSSSWSSFFSLPSVGGSSSRGRGSLGRAGAAFPTQQATPIGPNREIIMCGLTMPLVQVDLLQDKRHVVCTRYDEPASRSARGGTRAGGQDPSRSGRSDRWRGRAARDGLETGDAVEEQQDVVSLRLVGLGMQLHSKSYSARFSFSMQDLHLEDHLRLSQAKNASRGDVAGSDAPTGVSCARDGAGISHSPSTGGTWTMPDAGVEGQAGGDMATSRPRLFLWRRTDQPSRRGVKFSVGAVGDDGDVAQQSTASASSAVAPVAARGSEETKGPIADAVTIARVGQPEESGKGAEAGRQQPSGRGGRPDFVQLSYAMKKVPLGSGAVQRGKRRGIRQLQETHRVKLLVGALEMSLEQETVLALLRIASSAAADRSAPSPASPPPVVPPGNLRGRVGESDTDDAGEVESRGPSLPVLAQGVSATLAVDVAAVSVALTEAGRHVAAVTACAAHCKVNAEGSRTRAVASLGDLSVLDLLREPQTSSPSKNSAVSGDARRDEKLDHYGSDGVGPLLVDPVVGQAPGAIGPVFEVALAVGPSGASSCTGNSSQAESRTSRGSEARVRMKVDKMRTAVSIPFVESLARHVLTGPLVAYLVESTVAAQDTSDIAPHQHATPPVLDPSIAGCEEAQKGGATGANGVAGRGPSLRDAHGDVAGRLRKADGAPSNGPRGRDQEPIVFLKVGLEVSDYTLDVPLNLRARGGESNSNGSNSSKVNRITAKVGHLLASTVWTTATMGSSSSDSSSCSNDLTPGDHRPRTRIIQVEALLSSLAIKAEPEGFNILEAVHGRALAMVPFTKKTERPDDTLLESSSAGSHGAQASYDADRKQDELAEKLREKLKATPGAAAPPFIPPRPSLRYGEGVATRAAERPQLQVAVSPILFRLAEPHVIDFARFVVNASTRLTEEVSEILALPPWRTPPSPGSFSVLLTVQSPERGVEGATPDQAAQLPSDEVERTMTRERSGGVPWQSSGADNGQHGFLQSTAFDVGEAPTVSNEASVKSPVLPAFLGALVVEGVYVVMLTDPVQGEGGAPTSAGGLGVDASGDACGSPATVAAHSRAPAFCAPKPLRPDDPFQGYTPVLLLELRGVGVGIDVALPDAPTDHSSSSRSFSLGESSVRSQYRAEFAIKSVILTDVNPQRRRGSLIHLIGGGGGASSGDISAEEQGRRLDEERVLPSGWWNRGGGEDDGATQGYGEEVLCRALMCSSAAASTVSVDAKLSFGRFVLLPGPILDTLVLASRLCRGVATHRTWTRDSEAEVGKGVESYIGDVCASPGSGVRSNASSGEKGARPALTPLRSGDAHRFSDLTTTQRSHYEGMTTSSPSGIPVGRVATREQQDNGAQHHGKRGCARTRAARALGGAMLVESRWLERIELSLSASQVELWVPDAVDSQGIATTQPGTQCGDPPVESIGKSAVENQNEKLDVEAIVASCGYCEVTVAIAASRLSDAAASDDADLEPTSATSDKVGAFDERSDKTGDETKGSHDAEDVSALDSSSRPGVQAEALHSLATGDFDDEQAALGDELCVMSVCADAVSVSVARLSTPDSRTQIDPMSMFVIGLDGGSRERSRETRTIGGDSPSGSVPRQDEETPENLKTAGVRPNVTRVLERRHSDSLLVHERTLAEASLPASVGVGDTGSVGRNTTAVVDTSTVDGVVSGNANYSSSREGRGGGGSLRGVRELDPTRTRENFVLPFNVDVHHVLRLLETTPAPAPPLTSRVDVTVSAVELACSLAFPVVVSRILENSVEPLVDGAFSLIAEGNDRVGRDDDQPRESEEDEGSLAMERSSRTVMTQASTVASQARREPSASRSTEPELAALWGCRCALETEGLRLTVVNHFYRQKRPFVRISVQPINAELTASGADRTLKASLSIKIRSEFYNARLMAWEPLIEEWDARMELGLGARDRNDSDQVEVEGDRYAASLREGGVDGSHQRSLRRVESATHQRRGQEGIPDEEFNVSVRVASDKVFNMNLTEAFMENLAAVAIAQQQQHKEDASGSGDCGSEESFSLYWLRNETGLPLSCSAHCDPGGSGGTGEVAGRSLPFHVSAGEEFPMPSFNESSSLQLEIKSAVRRDAGARLADEIEEVDARASSRRLSERGRRTLEVRGIGDAATRLSSETSRSSGGVGRDARGRRQQRPVRWVTLEFEDVVGSVKGWGASPVRPAATRWRTLQPICVDAVGQRPATMDIMSSSPYGGRSARLSERSPRQPSGSGRWRWNRSASMRSEARRRDARGSRTTVITEVESHRGVKVLRVRSQVEVVNNAGDLSLRVGLLGAARARQGEPRLMWETVVHPGQSCPVPVSIASAVAKGLRPLIVQPVAYRPGADMGSSARSSVSSGTDAPDGGGRAENVPTSAPGPQDEFEEVVLPLPSLPTRGDGRTYSYHRTLAFAPTAPRGAGRRTIFCRVGVARGGGSGISKRRGESAGRSPGLVTMVSFESPLSLTNLLATPADVVLSTHPHAVVSSHSGFSSPSSSSQSSSGKGKGKEREGAAWSGTVDRGMGMSWFDRPPSQQVTMTIRVPGFEWSDAVSLPLPTNLGGDDDDNNDNDDRDDSVTSPRAIVLEEGEVWTRGTRAGYTTSKPSSVDVHVALKNSEGSTLRVNAEVTFVASELQQVALWVPSWVVNATSLPLTLRHYPSANGASGEPDSTNSREWQLPPAIASVVDAGALAGYSDADDGVIRRDNPEVSRESVSRGSPLRRRLKKSVGKESHRREGREDADVDGGGGSGAVLNESDASEDDPPCAEDGDDLARFKPLMLPHADPDHQKERRERLRLRVGTEGLAWSDSFGISQIGSNSSLEISGEPGAALDLKRGADSTRGPSPTSRKRVERPAYALAVSVKAAPDPFGRTKVVTLTPRYVVVNETMRVIEVQQAGLGTGAGIEPLKIASGAQVPFHWPKAGARGWLWGSRDVAGSKLRRLIVRRVGEGWAWSGELVPERPGDVTLRVRNGRTREVAFLRVSVKPKGSLLQLVFRDEHPSFAPYRIENLSLETLTLRQAGVDVAETLTPYRACAYSWDEPLGERALVVERLVGSAADKKPRSRRGGRRSPTDRGSAEAATEAFEPAPNGTGATTGERVDEIRWRSFSTAFVGVYGLDLIRPPAVVGNLRIELVADGPTRTLRVMDARLASALLARSPRASSVTAGGFGVSLKVGVNLAGVGVSVIDASPRELLYVTVEDITVDYLRGGQGERVVANIGKLQVDNQLMVTPYPALLYTITEALPPRHPAVRLSEGPLLPPLPSGDANCKTCFELILHRELGYAWVNFVRLVSVRVAPMDLNLDMALMDALLQLSTRIEDLLDVDSPRLADSMLHGPEHAAGAKGPAEAPRVSLDIPVSIESAGGTGSTAWTEGGPPNKLYLEELAISPIRLNVSFTSSSYGATIEQNLQPWGEWGGGGGVGDASMTRKLLRAIKITLGQIENARLFLKPVVQTHTFSNPEELANFLLLHYRRQAMRQVFRVMGGSKLLGSPVGLLSNIGAGIKDFFYEPVAGLSRSPFGFGFVFGVFKGTSSLVRRTLFSVTDTTDRIVSSVSSGILASGAVDVLVQGGSGVKRPQGALDGVLLGVAGAMKDPLLGLRSGGFSGMATGLVTGSIGLVLRPTYGTMMSTSQLCQVLSAYLNPRLDSDQKLRMLRNRPPRFFRSRQQVLSAYSREENIGEELLSRVRMGRYSSDGYRWHTTIKEGMIVLVTGRRVMMVHGKADGRANPSSAAARHSYGLVEWEVDFGLVICLETDEQEGRANPVRAPSARQQLRARGERSDGDGGDGDGDDSETCLWLYHVPDLCEEANGLDGGRRMGYKLPSLRIERRMVPCMDRGQVLQVCRVLSKQVHVAPPISTGLESDRPVGTHRRQSLERGEGAEGAGSPS